MGEVIEVCQLCGLENHFKNYDVVGNKYTAKCKNCRTPIMLCKECLESDDNRDHKCDLSVKNGCFRKR